MRAGWDVTKLRRLKVLFDEASELSPTARADFLESKCAGDAEMRQNLAGLLEADVESAFLDRSIPDRLREIERECEAELWEAAEEWLGRTLRGRYALEKVLGVGGSSRVFLASDRKLRDRPVVVKVLDCRAADARALETEIEALSRIQHPAVAAPLDAGETDEGLPYLVLEYIPGPSLRTVLQAGRPERPAALGIIRQIGAALSHVHRHGILHLDLKPENILFRESSLPGGLAVLVDFGIARASGSTEAGDPAGSPSYMAPEQFSGRPVPASDQYALAVIACELLTGARPVDGRIPAEPAEKLPRRLRTALERGLDRDASLRFPDVDAFLAAVDPRTTSPKRLRRQPILSLTAAAALIVVAMVSVVFAQRERGRRLAAEVALLEQGIQQIRVMNLRSPVIPAASVRYLENTAHRLRLLLRENSRHPALLSALVATLFEIANSQGHPHRRNAGNRAAAMQALSEAVEKADLLAGVAPGDLRARFACVKARDMLATILIEGGSQNEAAAHARHAESLLDEFPAGWRCHHDYLSLRAGLSLTLARFPASVGRESERLRLLDQAVETYRTVASGNGGSLEAHSQLGAALEARGTLLREMGRPEDALRDYEEYHGIVNGFLGADPENAHFRWMLAKIHLELGKTLIALGQMRQAVPRLSEAVTLLREIRSWSRTASSSNRGLAVALSWLALARRESGGSGDEISALARESRRLALQARAADVGNAPVHQEHVLIEQNLQRALNQ